MFAICFCSHAKISVMFRLFASGNFDGSAI